MSEKKVMNLTWDQVRSKASVIARGIVETGTEGPLLVYGIPRGGISAALLVVQALTIRTQITGPRAFLVDKPEEATVFVDDIIDTGRTGNYYHQKFNCPFFALVEKTRDDPWVTFPWERMAGEIGPEENVTRILEFIGEDPKREGLVETPDRIVRSWEKLFGGYAISPESVLKTFEDGACNEMVILRDIEFYSHCEHHMMPFFGKAHIGYIPGGKVVGISKLARLLEIYARRMQIQERIGQQVTAALMEHLQPQGCGCVLEAVHFCMTSRGVEKQNSKMMTSSMAGVFLTEPSVKSEFLKMIGRE